MPSVRSSTTGRSRACSTATPEPFPSREVVVKTHRPLGLALGRLSPICSTHMAQLSPQQVKRSLHLPDVRSSHTASGRRSASVDPSSTPPHRKCHGGARCHRRAGSGGSRGPLIGRTSWFTRFAQAGGPRPEPDRQLWVRQRPRGLDECARDPGSQGWRVGEQPCGGDGGARGRQAPSSATSSRPLPCR